MDLNLYLRQMATRAASDLFLSVGAPPAMKCEGETELVNAPVLDSQAVVAVADSLMSDAQKLVFAQTHEMNFTLARAQGERFRVNIYRQRGETAIAIRYIPTRIP